MAFERVDKFAEFVGVDKMKMRALSMMSIGRRVLLKSQDADVPDSVQVVSGLNIQAFKHGRENITLTDEDGFTADGYTLKDIHTSFID